MNIPDALPGSAAYNRDHFAADSMLVAGIGASAGGVEAMREFFENIVPDAGIAYVVILHLSPDYDSKLAEILQLATRVPVVHVTETTVLLPDHVYVVQPNQHLAIAGTTLNTSLNQRPEERRAPVDIFFRTLADAYGPRAVCVILSGTGANGSMGLKRVKEMGGAAFVQNPREAEFNEMPRNAIATGLIDEVLPVAALPAKIYAYKHNLKSVEKQLEAEQPSPDQQDALRDVFAELRMRTGHDFSNYKRPTVLRRIDRRINIRNVADLPAYAAFLQQHPDEVNILLKDLLISVTNFFRDQQAFDAIKEDVLPGIIQSKKTEEQVRIWVAGCATGEEAYSMAILCAEQTMSVLDSPKIQIIATDIDEIAIAHAREGFYTPNDAADVSAERLQRFFMKEGEGYRIRREIREMILFANHNFIKDPPFSRLDMISCRNVLIYLNRTAQERVMETLHFALNPGAYLFLGSSESADSANDMFTTFNREHHIFQSRKRVNRSFPVPESVPTLRIEPPRLEATLAAHGSRTLERITFGDLHQRLLEEYAPPSVVISEDYDIMHLSERAGKYLQIGGGEPSQNLLNLIRQELRLDLRSALYQAAQRQTAVVARGLKVNMTDRTETINIHVRPVLRQGDVAKGFILVLFEQGTEEALDGRDAVHLSDEPVARQLEEELMRLKAQLRASTEQHEFHAEELKASNEELQAMNEELRLAAEELETSKEELQSINEELRTVNQELKVKIDETSLSNNNLQNLINSSSIGTIFLDRSFRIALFTPAAREIFNLIPADYGRPLSDITHRLEYQYLLQDAETVLDKLQTVEQEVQTNSGRVYIMRVLPYRTAEDRINGVVITFIDITQRKLLEMQKDEFIGIASHELKTPVTSIKAYGQLLKQQLEKSGDAPHAELAGKLNIQVDRLTDLIRALLDTTKISEGQLALHHEAFDMNNMIEGVVEEIQRLSPRHDIVFHAGGVPAAFADGERVRQVISNLLSNAVKYSPNGGDIVITSAAAENGIKITVADKGIGIAPDLQQKVFNRFFRVTHPETNTFPGLGLGLYIAAGIVQRHGGVIGVESIPGKGSLFYFTLPLRKDKKAVV